MSDDPLEAVRCWVRRMVIGEGLCPFAAAPWHAGRVHLARCDARDDDGIHRFVLGEALALLEHDPAERETTLVAVPHALHDFDHYLDLLAALEDAFSTAGLDGLLQLASFHPRYRFAGEPPDDAGHWTNRAPVPLFHLLREESIDRARASGVDLLAIPERNRRHLRSFEATALRRMSCHPEATD